MQAETRHPMKVKEEIMRATMCQCKSSLKRLQNVPNKRPLRYSQMSKAVFLKLLGNIYFLNKSLRGEEKHFFPWTSMGVVLGQ